MERIAAMVEGHLEYHFMKEAYPNAIVQRCVPNGKNVDLSFIVDAISDQLEVIDGSINKIVILLDRERREETAEEVTFYLKEKLSVISPGRSFYVGVADLMVENWILSDEDFICNKYLVQEYIYCGDGVAGKSRLANITYDDLAPRDKARMLKAISTIRGRRKSSSLHQFVSQINFYWHWVLK